MTLYVLDYGAGNVQSLANSLAKLGHEFKWICAPEDFAKASKLIFPGVGSFHTAVHGLRAKGLFAPLQEYLLSRRPYFGICIGMQILFQFSDESPESPGLGLIPANIQRFHSSDKAVPHMGWNAVTHARAPHATKDQTHFYFVHSYCGKYDSANPDLLQWIHTTSQYGQELFVASVEKENIFGTQFHPEKSGVAGLQLLDNWLRSGTISSSRTETWAEPAIIPPLAPRDGLTKRIIACMDVRTNDEGDLVVTKGDQYDVREKVTSLAAVQENTAGAVRNLGKPVDLAFRYAEQGADEIALLNIMSFRQSPLHDQPMLAVVRAAAKNVFVPLTIGGGIKDTMEPDGTIRSALEVAGAYFRAGADKVSIGSEAVFAVEKLRANGGVGDGTSAIETIARMYGRQAVVVSIDPRRVYVDPTSYNGPYRSELQHESSDGPLDGRDKSWWYQCTVSGGRESRPLSVVELAKGVETLGAGEILLNSIDRDGTGRGFDIQLIRLVKRSVSIPVVASSGAGTVEHFVEVFTQTGVEAALAAGIFHRGEIHIQAVKDALGTADVNTRDPRLD